ncbi:hypothetical protein MGAS2096_Spy0667 [Streptococcus pyogenes MGAS2096]|nr:hypothetical protein MGAS2096_Spy0667 [Streptococcus pyogenes MGAS2096]
MARSLEGILPTRTEKVSILKRVGFLRPTLFHGFKVALAF